MTLSESLRKMHAEMGLFFNSGATRSVGYRKQQLQRLKETIRKNENNIFEALKKDLNKSDFESFLTEIGLVYAEIDAALGSLSKWAKPHKVLPSLATMPSSCYTVAEPLGLVLILSPWNYPFMLTFCPLAGAIAAGNCVAVKPSASAAESAKVIRSILAEAFDPSYCASVNIGGGEADELINMKWDHIFFTGSTRVGKIVMQAAARHLTPVTLELGGKSPAICHSDANINVAAKRIAWGKVINAGQTCIAPDYLFVHKKIYDQLVDGIKKNFAEMVPDPLHNSDYPRIISESQFKRLSSYLDSSEILFGGATDPEKRIISPTIINAPAFDSPVMTDEIFGPILPVFKYADIQEPINFIKSRPKPLALYLFATNRQIKKTVVNTVSYGGGCINDTLVHISYSKLPFGGVGDSGMGRYHGKYSFDTFSHIKSIVEHSILVDSGIRFPPFKRNLTGFLRKLI